MVEYSVVIPLYNEEENIRPLVEEVEEVMQPLQKPWELILVNDGSSDATGEICQELSREKPFVRVLTFTKNFGQSSAFDAGFRAAQGRYVITLDGDGQNDPHDIPTLLASATDFDLVCGQRKKRRDTFTKRMTSYVANTVRQRICRDGVQDTGCSLKIYRRDCLDRIKMFQGMHRFLPALFVIEGFRVKEIPVNHRERRAGTSKYNFFNRSFNTIADLWAVRWMRKRRLQYKIEDEMNA